MTTILSDGTKVRETKDDEFIPSFAENMDVKICNYCDRGCKFCHEGSSLHGKFGDILNENLLILYIHIKKLQLAVVMQPVILI